MILSPAVRSLQLGLGRGPAQLNTGNELAVAVGFKPKSSYNQLLGNAFNSRISEYDFAGNRASAVKQVTIRWYYTVGK